MLDALQGPWIEQTLKGYEQKCKELKELDESAYSDEEGEMYELRMNLYRADTKVITFDYYLRPETDSEDDDGFYLTKSYLFTKDQVEKGVQNG